MAELQARLSRLRLLPASPAPTSQPSSSTAQSEPGQLNEEDTSKSTDVQDPADSGYGSLDLPLDTQAEDCVGQDLEGTSLKHYKRQIPNHLNERFFDFKLLYTRRLLTAVSKKQPNAGAVLMKLKYLGTTAASAELYIVVQCGKKAAKIVKKFFKESDVKEELRSDFRVLVLEKELRLLADDEFIEVHSDGTSTQTWCGTPLTMSSYSGALVSTTFGGIIAVEDGNGVMSLYGLTASHALERLQATGLPTPDSSDTESEYSVPLVVGDDSQFQSQSGQEIRGEIGLLERSLALRPTGQVIESTGHREIVNTERLPDGEPVFQLEEATSGPKLPRVKKDRKGRMSISVPKLGPESTETGPTPSVHRAHKQPGSVEDHRTFDDAEIVGWVDRHTIHPSSQGNFDWALIECAYIKLLPNLLVLKQYLKPQHQLTTALVALQNQFLPLREAEVPAEVPLGSSPTLVAVLTRHGLQTASLTFYTSSMLIAPGEDFVQVHDLSIDSDSTLHPGDSGSWVANILTGEVYGHIVSVDAFGEAQVMPIELVLVDIKERLLARRVWLPSPEEISKDMTEKWPSKVFRDLTAKAQPLSELKGRKPTTQQIRSLERLARQLCRQLERPLFTNSNPLIRQISEAIRQLGHTLYDLRTEVADPESPLNRTPPADSVHGWLSSTVEGCIYKLRQLRHLPKILEIGNRSDIGVTVRSWMREEHFSKIASALADGKRDIDLLLDTIQLRINDRHPAGSVRGNETTLEGIKDKVDVVATRIYAWMDQDMDEGDEEQGWKRFQSELEKEGFSSDVLSRHQGVLRAYIHEVDAVAQQSGGAAPTVRGLLEREAKPDPSSTKMKPQYVDEKPPIPSMSGRDQPPGSVYDSLPASPAYVSANPQSLALELDGGRRLSTSFEIISTRDIVVLDRLASRLTSGLFLPSQHYGSSPTSTLTSMTASPSEPDTELTNSFATTVSGASPRIGRPLSSYASSKPLSYTSLAPDQYGKEIPMDGQWTKVRRTLISLEVLDRAGVRYEARPDYVAILGVFSHGAIVEFARQSTEARAARSGTFLRQGMRSGKTSYNTFRIRGNRSESEGDGSLRYASDSADSDGDKAFDRDERRYPRVVKSSNKDQSERQHPNTVQPKPILKNKSESHVRFDLEPQEIGERSHEQAGRPAAERRAQRYRTHRDDWQRHRERRTRNPGKGSGSPDRSEKEPRKKAWGETLGAVGIGGAAASLLSVLAEAAEGGI